VCDEEVKTRKWIWKGEEEEEEEERRKRAK
jgi:hypothetical protein